MTSNSYDYENRLGTCPISWEDFHGICKSLAAGVSHFKPEIILAIGRGGYYPGTLIAHLLRVDIYPVRLSRRVNDTVRYKRPKWLLEPTPLIRGKRALIVDEISGSGQTIRIVKRRAKLMGAYEVRSAVMYAHTSGVSVPDYIGLITDALLLNPWDREILQDGRFQFHPEYVDALAKQHINPDESMVIRTPELRLAKGGDGG